MDFPPVTNLVNAMFDELNYREVKNGSDISPQAPQPVASGEGAGSSDGLGLNSQASNGTNRVGTVLNTTA